MPSHDPHPPGRGRFLRSKALGLVWLDDAVVESIARELDEELTAERVRAAATLRALTVETDLGPAVLERELTRVLTGGRS